MKHTFEIELSGNRGTGAGCCMESSCRKVRAASQSAERYLAPGSVTVAGYWRREIILPKHQRHR